MKTNIIFNGDVLTHLKQLPENSVDAIITDPPYGLEFMGKDWDSFPLGDRGERLTGNGNPTESRGFGKNIAYGNSQQASNNLQKFVFSWATSCLRVLKPGGYLLSFGGTRTYHRLVCGIEDAGFEIRDTIMWLYGSGFPKSLNIGKQIDKNGAKDVSWFGKWLREWRERNNITQKEIARLFPSKTGGLTGCVANWELGLNIPTPEQFTKICRTFDLPFESIKEAEREVIGLNPSARPNFKNHEVNTYPVHSDNEKYLTAPATSEAKQWEGWGTALKPACEPIVVARKPLSEKNVALNVLKWGTGGINIGESRICFQNRDDKKNAKPFGKGDAGFLGSGIYGDSKGVRNETFNQNQQGRFPSNIILDEEAGKMLDEQSGESISSGVKNPINVQSKFRQVSNKDQYPFDYGDKGGASRFFYCAKASKSERNFGLDDKQPTRYEEKKQDESRKEGNPSGDNPRNRGVHLRKNNHPTVKPIKLMEYLIKLVTRKRAIVLDPFIGSGTTAIACLKLNRQFIGIEKEEEYVKIANARIKPYLEQRKLK
jgi:DNA modification methylase